eukprot:scaffold9500_cov60-Phaeocystis_antarctica.AAC.2
MRASVSPSASACASASSAVIGVGRAAAACASDVLARLSAASSARHLLGRCGAVVVERLAIARRQRPRLAVGLRNLAAAALVGQR